MKSEIEQVIDKLLQEVIPFPPQINIQLPRGFSVDGNPSEVVKQFAQTSETNRFDHYSAAEKYGLANGVVTWGSMSLASEFGPDVTHVVVGSRDPEVARIAKWTNIGREDYPRIDAFIVLGTHYEDDDATERSAFIPVTYEGL